MSGKYDLGDYVDVEARMKWFFDSFPTGSLQSAVVVGPEDEKAFVVVQAFAYRGPEDVRPGIGLAYEPFPGKTSFTNGSELMNAETSAWGRALAAIGAPTKGHVASADEVRGGQERQATPSKTSRPNTKASPPPAEDTEPVPMNHEHTFVQSPTMKSFVVCTDPRCRKVQKKEGADA